MPYPGRGHINPMLNLCKLILSKSNDVFITFVVTEEWLGFLSSEFQQQPLANFRFAALPQVIPSEAGRGADVLGFIKAVLTKLQDPFEQLLDQLELTPTAIIYDVIMSWVIRVGNQRNVPVASLVTVSASFFTVLSHLDLLVQYGHIPDADISERGNEVVDYIPGLPSVTLADLPASFQGDAGRKVIQQMLEKDYLMNNAQYLLSTSIYEFEEHAINSLKVRYPSISLYHIGPMIPYSSLDNKTDETGSYEDERLDYFRWLDSQPRGSVLYISQGSFLSISSGQSQEIIAGIKESGVQFLWVIRDDNDTSSWKDDISDQMGFLVPWCDQLRVLCHPSIGGFWTHCGWNSTSEGIYAGVPMLTCPIAWDQLLNSKMIVNDMEIGWSVIKNDHLQNGGLVTRHEIAKLVREFMDPENDKRKVMVNRAKELQNTFRKAIVNGGSATSDLEAFIKSLPSKSTTLKAFS